MDTTDILLTVIVFLLGFIAYVGKKISAKVDAHDASLASIDKKLDTHIEKCNTTHKFLDLINQMDLSKREEILATVDNLNKSK